MKKIGMISFIFLFYNCKQDIKVRYSLSSDTVSFSRLQYADTLRKIIYLKNHSNFNIKVLHSETACGCTSVILKDSIAKSNDSLALEIFYTPVKSKDTGIVYKYVTLRINSIPSFKNIIITGEVVQ